MNQKLPDIINNVMYLYSCLFYLPTLTVFIDLLIYFSFIFFILYLNYIVIIVDCVAFKILYVSSVTGKKSRGGNIIYLLLPKP
jgi:hypothetical protein